MCDSGNVIEFLKRLRENRGKTGMRDEARNEFVVLLTFWEIDGKFYPIITN